MPISIPSPLVEFILLGPADDRRQLQDSPILGDVWVAFGRQPAEPQDLLISPYKGLHSGTAAAAIDAKLGTQDDRANIGYLQGLIVAHLTFDEVVRVVVPQTGWWTKKWRKVEPPKTKKKAKTKGPDPEPPKVHEFEEYAPEKFKVSLTKIHGSIKDWHFKSGNRRLQELPSVDRFLALAALLLWASKHTAAGDTPPKTEDQINLVLDHVTVDALLTEANELVKKMLANGVKEPLVWQVSLNRTAMPALVRSIPAVKADAARTLFKVNCSDICWAVIDSGIDGDHPAFLDSEGKSRVTRSFDFKNFRQIVTLSNAKPAIRERNVAALLANRGDLKNPPTDEQADKDLQRLAEDAKNRGPVHWELVQKFVEIKPGAPPLTNHGTHVAGIIGASKEKASDIAKAAKVENEDIADGMCPDIELYDFRVLGPDIKDTEFAIIAALQFIRYLNDSDNFLTIHGANLSLSIPHDVRNFACGRTPICIECERLVESGVFVVAAAGNHGYKSFETKEGSYESYAAFSITDPGNADGVMTVGATHRFWPHTYGVSFFSSRGPTGDGRLKPDLVAPGERIKAPLLGNHQSGGEWGDLDGTSMAAPHVSGAAAMLMARYSELIGQPRRIKKMLCDSATDLGRERSFQGHGMLDVLRAFQSI